MALAPPAWNSEWSTGWEILCPGSYDKYMAENGGTVSREKICTVPVPLYGIVHVVARVGYDGPPGMNSIAVAVQTEGWSIESIVAQAWRWSGAEEE